jgi:outer membrane lipopolysaccharide assembly protein LptE/RlpB
MKNDFLFTPCAVRRALCAITWRYVGLVITACVLVASCGYRFPGSGNLPSGVNRIFVTTFENRTRESGLETTITDDLILQLIQNQKNAVTSRKEEADAVLSGVIESIRNETVVRATERIALERRVTITVSLKLVTPDGRVIWYGDGISENETYKVAGDEFETELNKKAAITVSSSRLAERVYDRLTDDF